MAYRRKKYELNHIRLLFLLPQECRKPEFSFGIGFRKVFATFAAPQHREGDTRIFEHVPLIILPPAIEPAEETKQPAPRGQQGGYQRRQLGKVLTAGKPTGHGFGDPRGGSKMIPSKQAPARSARGKC